MEPSPESLVIQTDCKTIRLEIKPGWNSQKNRKDTSLIKITEAAFREQLEQKVPMKTQSSH